MTGQETPPAPRWIVDRHGALMYRLPSGGLANPALIFSRAMDEETSLAAHDALVAAVTDTERLPLWTCPACAFTYAAEHTDTSTGENSCPECENARLWEFVRAYDAKVKAVENNEGAEAIAAAWAEANRHFRAARAALGDTP